MGLCLTTGLETARASGIMADSSAAARTGTHRSWFAGPMSLVDAMGEQESVDDSGLTGSCLLEKPSQTPSL
jgi:hypothetical protein